jgi:tRNA(Arg) A34 adenosine deaminase TadA
MSTNPTDHDHLRGAIALAAQARANGNHPFGALLADAQGDVLLQAENTVVTERDCTAHAELNLVRQASRSLPAATLATCTLYTSTEPCPMCSGAIFWSQIGRVVYALSEQGLYQATGDTDDKLLIPCRSILTAGARPIVVVGPLLEDEAVEVHRGFWG